VSEKNRENIQPLRSLFRTHTWKRNCDFARSVEKSK